MKQVIFDKKNILIFGGAGFLGSHLCEELVKNNKIICVDNFVSSSVENIRFLMQLPNFRFIKHDIAQPLILENCLELKDFKIEFQGIQEIYNLACPTSAKNFDNYIIETLDANSLALKNILELVKKYQAKFVHASSAVVYGPRQDEFTNLAENYLGVVDFTSPRSSYDEGKRFAETMCINYRNFYKLPIKIARVFRTYGPRMLLNDGQMIPDFIVNALENKDLVIYGNANFSTSLAYISDVIDGLVRLMDSSHEDIYNIGSDVEFKLEDVAKSIIKMTDSHSSIIFKDPLAFITPLSVPDISKIRNDLDWFPITKLEEGLEKTIEYTKANKILITNGHQPS
ncbi:MAG: NAD-dependent dehydratase [Candidatus Komeilibacteria bacterium CG_4_9_14_3_um_filter_37_5]|nr:MAG: NAD-dependent dehydratase [Candidatus Komeilibacteria bacterium CG_4_9_14_3_um_filter_37_5]